jgi:hypothetical protein
MKRLSMNELTTYRWSFEEDVVNYRAAGISAISVWREKIADFGEERGWNCSRTKASRSLPCCGLVALRDRRGVATRKASKTPERRFAWPQP